MSQRKKTTSTSGNTRRTTTLNANGTKTTSYSNKQSSSTPRRTRSLNYKTGKIRTTTTTNLGNGYSRTRSYTSGGKRLNKREHIPHDRYKQEYDDLMSCPFGDSEYDYSWCQLFKDWIKIFAAILVFIFLCLGVWELYETYQYIQAARLLHHDR